VDGDGGRGGVEVLILNLTLFFSCMIQKLLLSYPSLKDIM
jgi:hypothetical protein